MAHRILTYNFSGEVDEITHLFPSERLARFAGAARCAGCEVDVVDRANFDDLASFGGDFMQRLGELAFEETDDTCLARIEEEADTLLARDYDLIFMNLWHGSGFKFSIELARFIRKKRPETRIFGIGQKVDWFTRHILDLTGDTLDGLVTGLGYNAVPGLLAGRPLDQIPNLIYRERTGIRKTENEVLDIDACASPCYEPSVYQNLTANIPVFPIALSNQACPNHCVYCVRPENYGHDQRARRTETVLAEMLHLHEDCGARHFRIEDSTPPKQGLTALARAILNSPLRGRIKLSAFARIDVGRGEAFETMREAGFVSLFFGLESLDDERLEALRKGFKYEAIRATVEAAHRAGIRVVGSLIFPTPGETKASMQRTLERLETLRAHVDSIVLLPAGVYPPTEWGQNPEAFGIRLSEDYIRKAIVYPIKYLVPLELWKPLPFTYDLNGEPARNVTFQKIVAVQKTFARHIRKTLHIPGIPDYYFLAADLAQTDPADMAARLVTCIMNRNYNGMRALFNPTAGPVP